MTHHLVLKYRLLKSMESDHPGQVEVVRYITRKGSTFPEHYWVNPDEVGHNEKVMQGHHNLPNDHPQRYKKFGNSAEAYAYMGDVDEKGMPYDNWEQTLTKEESQAVIAYTGTEYYREINGTMRGTRKRNKVTGERLVIIKQMINNIRSALDKFDLKDDILVYRRTNIRMYKKYLDAYNNGGLYCEKGFLSTTLVKSSFGKGRCDIVIKVPKGKGRGAWIAPRSLFRPKQEENEFLLNSDQMFIVKAVHPPEKGKNALVELELIDVKSETTQEGTPMKKSMTTEQINDRLDRFTAHEEDATFIHTPQELKEWAKQNGKSDVWVQQVLNKWRPNKR